MNNRTRKWIRAGIETLIHGGTSAVISTIAAALVDPKSFGFLTSGFWAMLGTSFMGNGGLRFFQWWNANPLPPEGDTGMIDKQGNSIVAAPKISLNPLAKVQPVIPTPVNPKQLWADFLEQQRRTKEEGKL